MALHSDLSDDVSFSLIWWRERLTDPCFVYVIQEAEGPTIKVGRAKDPEQRIACLQTGNWRELHIRYLIPGGADVEAHFHRRLRFDRVLGEWFHGKAVPPFLDYIDGLTIRMMDAYVEGSGVAPHLFEVDPVRFGRVRKPPRSNPVEVRFVESATL